MENYLCTLRRLKISRRALARSHEESVKASPINCKIIMALKPFIKICYDAAVHDLSLSAYINIHHGSRVRAGYVLLTRRE